MDIFETDRARIKRRLQAFLPILLLAAVCLIFYLGITGAGRETVTKEQTTLKRALEQGAIHTYALTGNYPQNLEELLTDYKISYDMNNKLSPRHSVHRIFVVMIFGLFLLFLLLMLLFGARAYSVSVADSQKNNNLYTASAYVTAKFRQHDTGTDQQIY